MSPSLQVFLLKRQTLVVPTAFPPEIQIREKKTHQKLNFGDSQESRKGPGKVGASFAACQSEEKVGLIKTS